MKKVLVVDDEKNILTTLSRALSLEGYEVAVAGGGKIALEKAASWQPDVVLLDVSMPDIDGLDVLAKLKEPEVSPAVIMMSGHGTIETAVKATKAGASDFVEKPVSLERVLLAIANAFDRARLVDENRRLKADVSRRYRLVGDSAAMKQLKERIALAAPKNGRVLITGESGTGKELIAHAIHSGSARASKPFVKMNCAAVPGELIESELFGHEKGSFTGAVKSRIGRFEQADSGTLFIDEVGDMPPPMQAKLLRVLQEGELSASAARRSSRSTCASSPRRTRTCRPKSRRGASGRTSTIASTSCRSRRRRSARARTTCRCCSNISSRRPRARTR